MSSVFNTEAAAPCRGGLGIASFALGAISVFAFILLSVYATAFNRAASANTLIGEIMALIWMINSLGIGLGVAGIVRRRARKTFAVLGITANLGLMSLSAALIAIGLHVG